MTEVIGCYDCCNVIAFSVVLLPYPDDELGLRCLGVNKE